MKKLIFLFMSIFFVSSLIMSNGQWTWDNQEDWEGNTLGTKAGCVLTDCNTGIYPGSVTIQNILSDEFNGPSLGANWVYYNGQQASNFYNFSSDPGSIRLISYPGAQSWWCITDYAKPVVSSIFQYADRTKNFELEVLMKQSDLVSHEWGGITFFVSDTNMAKTYRVGFQSYSSGIHIGCRDNCSEQGISYYSSMTYPEYFKVVNSFNGVNNTLSFYYRNNPASGWVLDNTYTNLSFNKMIVGMERSDTDSNKYADFEYFHYTGNVTKTAVVESKWLNLGSAPIGVGTISWEADYPGLGNTINVYTQTSDDGISFPEVWKGPLANASANIMSTNRKYIRFKVFISSDNIETPPVLKKVTIEYPSMSPQKPVVSSLTNPEDTWVTTKNAYVSWTDNSQNNVNVGKYYYSIDENLNTLTALSTVADHVIFNNISEGLHDFNIIAEADASNTYLCSDMTTFYMKVDSVPPNLPAKISSTHEANVESNSNIFNIKLNLSDSIALTTNVSGICGISYVLSRNELEAPDKTVDSASGDITFNNLDNGTWYFNAVAVDRAGNTSSIFSYCIKVNFTGNLMTESGTKLYPNPTAGQATLKYELSASAEKVSISIKDSGGRQIRQLNAPKAAGNNTESINMSGMPNGVYFVQITAEKSGGKTDVVVKKIVVKK